LKKQLAGKTKAELIQEITTLYQMNPQVKEYFLAQSGNAHALLAGYKEIIEKEFVDGKTRGGPKARIAVARKAVNDLKKLTKEPALVADIMLTYVECISSFNDTFGPDTENYYTSPENMFDKTLAYMDQHDLLDQFHDRALAVYEDATDGWGHKGSLRESYYDYYSDIEQS